MRLVGKYGNIALHLTRRRDTLRQLLTTCAVFLSLLLASYPAFASDVPFVWPESFKVTDMETNKTKQVPPFFNAFVQDGLKARNQYVRDNAFHIEIFHLDEHKKIDIEPDGTVRETMLPVDWPRSHLFPRDHPWELLGIDTVNGLRALKYKALRKPTRGNSNHDPYMLIWLSADNKIPLRMEVDDIAVDFLNYSPGPQNLNLFEPIRK